MEEEEFETIKVIKPITNSKEISKRFLWSKHPNEEIVILDIIKREFKEKVNAKSVPASTWETISNIARSELGSFSDLEAITGTSVKSCFRGLKLSYQNFKEGKTKSGKKPRHYDLLNSIICDKPEDTVSFSFSESPELKSIGRKNGKFVQHKTPSMNEVPRVKLNNILQIANAAQPTPVLAGFNSKSSFTSMIPNLAKKDSPACLLCGLAVNKMDDHYSSCLDNVEDPSIIETLEKSDKCYFCKMDWISSYVSASYRINHMKDCCSSTANATSNLSMIIKYLSTLKVDGLPETPLLGEGPASRGGALSKAFEFLKPAPKLKHAKKKSSPAKNTLIVTDDSVLVSRRAAVLNPVSVNNGPISNFAPASFHQSIRVMDSDAGSVETAKSLFSMGNGSVSIKKKIDAVRSINPDSSSQPINSQNNHSQTSPKRAFDEFDMDKSHLLDKVLSKRERSTLSPPKILPRNPSFEELSGIEQMKDLVTENHSYLVISPKRQRVEESSYQFLSCSQVSMAIGDFEGEIVSDPIPDKKIPVLGYSSTQMINIPPDAMNRVRENLGFSLIRCFEYVPVAVETEDFQVQAVPWSRDAGNQTDVHSRFTLRMDAADSATQTEEWENALPHFISTPNRASLCDQISEKVCLHLSETEDIELSDGEHNVKRVVTPIAIEDELGSEQDLFTPDCFYDSDCAIPDFAVSQDISRIYDVARSAGKSDLSSEIEANQDLDLLRSVTEPFSPKKRNEGPSCQVDISHPAKVITLSDDEVEGLPYQENLPDTEHALEDNESDSNSIECISEDLPAMNQSQHSIASTIIECSQQVSSHSSATLGHGLFGQMAAKKAKRKETDTREASPEANFVHIMPNYPSMSLDELQSLGQGFGLKATGRKLLISKLTEIWHVRNNNPTQPIVSSRSATGSSLSMIGITTASSKNALQAAIRADKDLYHKILCYEPINLDEAMSSLSARLAFPLSRKMLMEFFDEHGIHTIARKD